MSHKTTTCVVVDCDDCGSAVWDDNDEYGTPHWSSLEVALKELGEHYSWAITEPTKQVCQRCGEKRDCAATGHQWSEWWHSRVVEDPIREYRRCHHCGRAETRDTSPGGGST